MNDITVLLFDFILIIVASYIWILVFIKIMDFIYENTTYIFNNDGFLCNVNGDVLQNDQIPPGLENHIRDNGILNNAFVGGEMMNNNDVNNNDVNNNDVNNNDVNNNDVNNNDVNNNDVNNNDDDEIQEALEVLGMIMNEPGNLQHHENNDIPIEELENLVNDELQHQNADVGNAIDDGYGSDVGYVSYDGYATTDDSDYVTDNDDVAGNEVSDDLSDDTDDVIDSMIQEVDTMIAAETTHSSNVEEGEVRESRWGTPTVASVTTPTTTPVTNDAAASESATNATSTNATSTNASRRSTPVTSEAIPAVNYSGLYLGTIRNKNVVDIDQIRNFMPYYSFYEFKYYYLQNNTSTSYSDTYICENLYCHYLAIIGRGEEMISFIKYMKDNLNDYDFKRWLNYSKVHELNYETILFTYCKWNNNVDVLDDLVSFGISFNVTNGNDKYIDDVLYKVNTVFENPMYELLGGGYHTWNVHTLQHYEKKLYRNPYNFQLMLYRIDQHVAAGRASRIDFQEYATRWIASRHIHSQQSGVVYLTHTNPTLVSPQSTILDYVSAASSGGSGWGGSSGGDNIGTYADEIIEIPDSEDDFIEGPDTPSETYFIGSYGNLCDPMNY